jgi:hypothetical protein
MEGDDETEEGPAAVIAGHRPKNPRYSLRTNRGRNYDNRLSLHQMDNPESSQSYGTQFVQLEDHLKDDKTTLRQAVMEM